jgi:hypothetical protein
MRKSDRETEIGTSVVGQPAADAGIIISESGSVHGAPTSGKGN